MARRGKGKTQKELELPGSVVSKNLRLRAWMVGKEKIKFNYPGVREHYSRLSKSEGPKHWGRKGRKTDVRGSNTKPGKEKKGERPILKRKCARENFELTYTM